MAARSVKKVARKPKKSAAESAPAVQTPGATAEGMGGGGFKIFLALIVVVLGVMYGPGLFKSGPPPKPNNFLLKKVAQFNINPAPTKTFFATDIAAIPPNKLVVTDCPGCQVLQYDYRGKLVRKWGKAGKGPKELYEPSAIRTDKKGNSYVLDTWNGAVKIFDQFGNLQKVVDLTHFGFFYGPRRMGFAGDSVLIPNPSNFRLARVSLAGQLQSIWEGPDSVGKASAAISDGKGHFYVADDTEKKGCVRVLDETGKVLRTIKTGGAPGNMALDSKGRLFVEGTYGSSAYDADGNFLGVLADEAEIGKPIYYNGIDVASDDTLLTTGGNMVTIYKVAEQKEK